MRPRVRTLADLLLLAVLEGAWCWPLPIAGGTAVPGGTPTDNLAFLWNMWWARKALATPGLHLLDTGYLFYPFHVDLALHTHTVLNALVGATLLARLSPIAALNATILASLVLAAWGAYALARDLGTGRRAAILAGVVFGQCPYLAAHLAAHFNLTSAWVLPWFLFAFGRALDRGSRAAALAAGLCLAATAYTDYYYLVFAIVAAAAWTIAQRWTWTVSLERRPLSRARLVAIVTLAAATELLVAAAVVVFVQVHRGAGSALAGTFDLRAAIWALSVAMALLVWRVKVDAARSGAPAVSGVALLAMAVLAVAVVPLAVHAVAIFRNGDYASQSYGWQTSPEGMDLLALVAGNPFHPVWGRWSAAVYAWMHEDLFENVAWLGIVPALLTLAGWRRGSDDLPVRRWRLLLVLFFIWALGPFVRVAGVVTGFVLPQTLVRFVPIVANARMPGRAMAMVYLAMAALGAVGLESLRGRWSRPTVQWAVIGLAAFGYLRAPMPMFHPAPSPIALAVARSPIAGAVVNLPIGLADGFEERGLLDRRTLYLQTIHERPITGGFVARLSAHVPQEYDRLPVVGAWWRLSKGETLGDDEVPRGRAAVDALRREGFAFVVLDTAAAPPVLVRSVDALGLPVVLRDGSQVLYGLGAVSSVGSR